MPRTGVIQLDGWSGRHLNSTRLSRNGVVLHREKKLLVAYNTREAILVVVIYFDLQAGGGYQLFRLAKRVIAELEGPSGRTYDAIGKTIAVEAEADLVTQGVGEQDVLSRSVPSGGLLGIGECLDQRITEALTPHNSKLFL